MSTVADSLIASDDRPVRVRKRPDLEFTRQSYQGRVYWAVKDPIALRYYRMQEEEFALLEMLDGQITLAEIKRRFERRFAPRKITYVEIDQFLQRLYASSLIVSHREEQGAKLYERERKQTAQKRWMALTSVLCMRFPGVDPDRLLTWLSGRVGWMFSAPAVVVGCAMMLAAAAWIAVQFSTFYAKLPAFYEFFALENWIWLALTLAVTKILHEIGHGLSCKRLGGECHEIGIMLLVLTPCMYCNVSDSWMLRNKWHRAAIGAAGMYVELVLASVCTFVWWFTNPGLLHYLCLNVMFVSSVSTLLFNANPLLRFDGYYILSDLAEIPNLRQKADAIFHRTLSRWILGIESPPDPFLPRRGKAFFIAYSVAAVAYKWVILFSILRFLYFMFEPYGLQILGQTIAVFAVTSMLVQPMRKMWQFFSTPGRLEQVKFKRLGIWTLIFLACLAGVLAMPVPHRIVVPLAVKPRNAETVYVAVPGAIREIHVKGGERVAAGDRLLRLESDELALAIANLEGERGQLAGKLEGLRALSLSDNEALEEISHVSESLAAVEDQLRKRYADRERLDVCSPGAGTVIPAENRPREEGNGKLRTWTRTPIHPQNLSAFLTEKTVVCHIGNPRELAAILTIDQKEMEFIAAGQRVDIQLDQFPGRIIASSIEHVAIQKSDPTARVTQSASQTDMGANASAAKTDALSATLYEASVPLDDPNAEIHLWSRGQARVHVGYRTIGYRIWRYLAQTFRIS